ARGAAVDEAQPRRGGGLMLRIRDLTAAIDGRRILNGVDLDVDAGEVHSVMGPNGAGTSTLANVLAGRDGYQTAGSATFDGVDLLALTPEERAGMGVFRAFQYPVELPGVGNMYSPRTAVNSVRAARGEPE